VEGRYHRASPRLYKGILRASGPPRRSWCLWCCRVPLQGMGSRPAGSRWSRSHSGGTSRVLSATGDPPTRPAPTVADHGSSQDPLFSRRGSVSRPGVFHDPSRAARVVAVQGDRASDHGGCRACSGKPCPLFLLRENGTALSCIVGSSPTYPPQPSPASHPFTRVASCPRIHPNAPVAVAVFRLRGGCVSWYPLACSATPSPVSSLSLPSLRIALQFLRALL